MLGLVFLALLLAAEAQGAGPDRTTQIILAVIGVVGTISTGVIAFFTAKATKSSTFGAENAKKEAIKAKGEAQAASQEAKDYAIALEAKNAVIDALRQEVTVHKDQIAFLRQAIDDLKEEHSHEREEYKARIAECQAAMEAASKLEREYLQHITEEHPRKKKAGA